MARERGLRSSNDAKPWKCRCGKVNHPKKHRFVDTPSWQCRGCNREFNGNFKFCLGEVEVDGGSLIGEVWDQQNLPYCVAFAYGKGIEIVERVSSVNNGTDPNEVKCIDPIELEHTFRGKFPDVPSDDIIIKDYGIQKMLHMGLILREEGIRKKSSCAKYQLEDLSTIPRDDFSSIMDCLAQGIPFVGTYLAGKRRSKLKYCQIYKSAPKSRYAEKKADRKGHAVVLIGGGMEEGKKFFYGLSSWNKNFCPRKNSKGEIIKGGIGKIRASDLTKNVIKLSHPEKTDPCRRLEAQDVFNISSKNFILMMALKGQFTAMPRRGKVQSEKSDENMQFDDEIKKFREDHMVHGPFCDDEAEYAQNLEDRYKEYSSEEMEDSCMNNEKLHRNKVTKTDDTIQLVHDVALPTTSSAVDSFLGNQGPNQPDYLATTAPVVGSESGTRITTNSRTVAIDGDLGDHMVHGPFCDDEAEYAQNLEDRYKEYSSEEMEDSCMNNEKLHRNKVTKTDDTIQLVHDVALPTTSSAVDSFLGNQGPNQPDYLATTAPVVGSESGTRIATNSRTVAIDGDLGDHMVHGPFCDDEAEYAQNLEDRYKEYSSEETEDSCMNNEKLHRNKVTKTDDTIQLVHDVALPTTSSAVDSFLGNQGPNQPDYLATTAPVVGSESGTRITTNSRAVAIDGDLGGTGGNADLDTRMSMLPVAVGGKALPKTCTAVELQAGSSTTPLSSEKSVSVAGNCVLVPQPVTTIL